MSTRRPTDHLQCNICLETFVRPRVLPCAHSFCEECIRKFLAKMAIEQRRTFPAKVEVTCPLCREPITVREKDKPMNQWTELFPLNHLVISILDDDLISERVVTCTNHKGKQIQYLCTTHNEFACSKCLLVDHRTCFESLKLVEIEEDDVKTLSETILGRLREIKTKLTESIGELGSIIDNICLETDAILEYVKAFTEDVHRALKDIEQHVVTSVNELRAEETTSLNKRRKMYKEHVHEIDTGVSLIQYLDANKNNSPLEIAMALQKVQETERLAEAEIETEEPLVPVSFQWALHREVSQIQDNIAKMLTKSVVRKASLVGEFDEMANSLEAKHQDTDTERASYEKSLEQNTCELRTFTISDDNEQETSPLSEDASLSLDFKTIASSQEKPTPLWFRKAEYTEAFKITGSKTDMYKCDITSSVVLRDGRIVLVDYENYKIKYFTAETHTYKYTQCKERQFKGRPWGIACFPADETMVAISFPFHKRIAILDIDNERTEPKKIRTRRECYGIAFIKDTIVTVTSNDGHCILFLDQIGNELRTISLKETSNPNTLKPIAVTFDLVSNCLHVACQGNKDIPGSLVTMDTNGQIKHVYTEPDMYQCYSSATDCDGNVYVCGYTSSTVHVISRTGDATKCLLSHNDGINKPSHMTFFPSGDTFLLTDSSSLVKIFKLTAL